MSRLQLSLIELESRNESSRSVGSTVTVPEPGSKHEDDISQSFGDLEIGNTPTETSTSGPFSLFSPPPKPTSKLKFKIASKLGFKIGSSDERPEELPGLTLSPPGSPQEIEQRKVIDKKQKKERSVVFSPSVRVRLIPSQKEIPKGQKQSIWYTLEEAKEIRNKAIQVVERMSNNEPLGDNETSRGLETKTPKEHKVRRRSIRRTILTVLRAQDKPASPVLARLLKKHQAISSLDTWDDAEYLASLYRYESRENVAEASWVAEIDAEEARNFYDEDHL